MSFQSLQKAQSWLFKGGVVVDGTGRPPTVADVRVDGDRIVEVAPELPMADSRVIDIQGRVLAPGFIDLHAHSEGPLWREPGHEAKIRQGVTFELLGQDGLGFAPIESSPSAQILNDRLVGWHGVLEDVGAAQATISKFGDSLESRGVPVNFGLLVPHGTIRLSAMGDRAGPPSAHELQHMTRLLDRGLRDGAFGLSTGLAYTPAAFASREELVHLCRAMGRRGVFVPHLRDYGRAAMDSYSEGIEIAEESEVPLHLTHAVLNGPSNQDAAGHLMTLVSNSRARISLDVYPYDAGSTYLQLLLPRWAMETSEAERLSLIADRSQRSLLKTAFLESDVRWDRMKISDGQNDAVRQLAGLSIADIARQRNCHPVDVYCEILATDRLATTFVHFNGHMENIEKVLLDGVDTAVASDSILLGSKPHPRGFGTFARLFEQFVNTGKLSAWEAVRRVTGLPARILGLHHRGVISVGAFADIVCFDPSNVREHATYEQPRTFASGFDHVFVNGHPAILNDETTGDLAGKFVRNLGAR